jgi:AraC family transcriptional regulator of arabinose operon
MQQDIKNFFENITVKNLICRVNYCAPDWGETNCIYGYNKFYYFLDGEGTLIIEEDEFHPEPEELFLIPANTRHTYYHNPKKPVYKYWCHFDLSLNDNKKLVYSNNGVKCKLPRKMLEPIFQKLMASEMSKSPLDILLQKTALLELLSKFMQNIDYMSILPAPANNLIKRIDDYLSENIGSNITLSDLAGIAHLHPNYFTQYFKKRFNVSPIEYVNIFRLEKAARLLINHPDKSIAAIAMELCFCDYRYFSRLFRKRYGITPSAYRNSLKRE